MTTIKSYIKQALSQLVDLFRSKIHLNRDTVVVNLSSWRIFDKKMFPLNIDYCTYPLRRIDPNDLFHVKAYIGSITPSECRLLGDRFEWLQLASHGYNGLNDPKLFKSTNVRISNLVDVYSEPISQYVIAMYYVFNTLSIRRLVSGGGYF